MKILAIYLPVLLLGQAGAVGIGLLFDRISGAAGVAAFIPIYYAMFWVAWRVVLFFLDERPAAETARPSRTTAALWLLAPAGLAIELAD